MGLDKDTSLLFSWAKHTWFGKLNLFWKHMQGRKFQEVQLEHEEEFYCSGGWALDRAAWRRGGVFLAGDIQKPSGHSLY